MASKGPTPGKMITEINVTPFVDIMLVLLIIFMIAAPSLYKSGMKLNLPKAGSADKLKSASMAISIDHLGQIAIDHKTIPREEIRKLIQEALAKDPLTEVVIAADEKVPHGDVIKVMDQIKSGGIQNISLLVDSAAK